MKMIQYSKIVMTMRKVTLFAALVVAMMTVSCIEKQEPTTPEINEDENLLENIEVVFEAAFEESAETKAVLNKDENGNTSVLWNAGDKISVLVGEDNFLYATVKDGPRSPMTTEQTGVPTEGPHYAVHPYDENAELVLDDEKPALISTLLPKEQVAVEESFTTHLAVSQAEDRVFKFKNVCGLVKVTVNADNVSKIVLEGNNGEVVAGGINVTVTGEPAWAAIENKGETSVTLVAESGSLKNGASYYFAVLPQTFEKGFKVTAYKGEESWVIRNVVTKTTINRAGIVGSKAFFEIEGNGTEANPYILKTADHLVGMRSLATLDGETWFKMANDIDMAGVDNYVPVNFDQNFRRKIHFDGGTHTITNFTCDNSQNGVSYPSIFGVLYGSCTNLNVDNAIINSTHAGGVIGGYVGTTGKPAHVENVIITNSSVTSSGQRSGGVCGVAREATFKNVTYKGSMTNTYANKEAKSGGFLGQAETSVSCENCTADVVVKGAGNDIGGFAGKLLNKVMFTNCSVKAEITSSIVGKNRCGGFVGWNSSENAVFTNCHVVEGSTITSEGTWSSATNGNFGGFIGFGDTDGSVVEISGCSASVNMNVSDKGNYNGGFIGGFGYKSTVTITDCYAKGTVQGSSYCGGFIGSANSDITISKCWADVDLTLSGQRNGAFVGVATSKPITIRDCYSTGDVTATGQQTGGILGFTDKKVIIERCYATGEITSNTAASAGIVGTLSGAGSLVSKCIAWNANITCNRPSNTRWAPGAIVGAANVAVTLQDCYRRNDMVFYDKPGSMTLYDQENIVNDIPSWPSYADASTQSAYHGKAAAADATASSVAKSLGWSEDVWDLSKDIPTLK